MTPARKLKLWWSLFLDLLHSVCQEVGQVSIILALAKTIKWCCIFLRIWSHPMTLCLFRCDISEINGFNELWAIFIRQFIWSIRCRIRIYFSDSTIFGIAWAITELVQSCLVRVLRCLQYNLIIAYNWIQLLLHNIDCFLALPFAPL